MFKVITSVSKVSKACMPVSTTSRSMAFDTDKAITTVQWKTKLGRKHAHPGNKGPLVDNPDFHFVGR
jgi:hypothetical protein